MTAAPLPPTPARASRHSVLATARVGVPIEVSVRVMAAMGGPMVLAVMFDRPDLGALASIGTLHAPSVGAWTYPQRGRRLPVLALLMGTAFAAGLAAGGSWIAVVLLVGCWATAATLIGGLLGAWAGPFAVLSTVALLLGTGLGSSPWSPLVVLAGGLWVAVVFCLGWFRGRWVPETRAVADTYSALAEYLAAIGTPSADAARSAARRTLLRAWDAVGMRAPDGHDPGPRRRLFILLLHGQRLLDAAVSLAFERVAVVPDELAESVRALSMSVDDQRLAGLLAIPVPAPTAHRQLRRYFALVEEARAVAAQEAPTPHLSVLPLRVTVQDRLHRMPPVRAVYLRTAMRLGICVAVADALSLLAPAPSQHHYWVALSALLAMRDDPAGTHVRAVQRGLGTVLGVCVAGGLLLARPSEQVAALGMVLVGYFIPGAMVRNYTVAAALRTAFALLLIEAPNPPSLTAELLVERVLDTVVGVSVAVVAVLLLWPHAATQRLPRAVAGSLSSVSELLRQTYSVGGATHDQRKLLIPRLLSLRTLFDRAVGERPIRWPSVDSFWPVVVFTLRLGTPVRLAAEMTSPVLTRAGARDVANALDGLAGAAELGRTPPTLPWAPGSGGSGLHDVVEELHEAVGRAAYRR